MNKFLKIHKLQKVTQEEIGYRKIALFLFLKFEFVIKTFPQRKLQAQTTSPINSIIYLQKN